MVDEKVATLDWIVRKGLSEKVIFEMGSGYKNLSDNLRAVPCR